eukprot:RCo038973
MVGRCSPFSPLPLSLLQTPLEGTGTSLRPIPSFPPSPPPSFLQPFPTYLPTNLSTCTNNSFQATPNTPSAPLCDICSPAHCYASWELWGVGGMVCFVIVYV